MMICPQCGSTDTDPDRGLCFDCFGKMIAYMELVDVVGVEAANRLDDWKAAGVTAQE